MEAPTLEQLKAEVTEVTLQVHLAQERQDERDVVATAHAGVERLSQRYRELLASLPPGQQLSVERAIGRRVVDLKRLASLLPKVPTVATESTPDRRAGGGAPEGRRITGVSWTQERVAPAGVKARVGGDVESWCGRCADLTTHSIVAMVGDDAKQVLCQVCGSRHAHRTTATRRTATGATSTAGGETEERSRPTDPEARRRAAELRALGEEIAASTTVRAFDPKERYKAGEIISHPEFGRGKIENVLRSSLLVRFPVGGLKSVMLI
ncbi:MAG TPA: hypothetical protein VHG72_23395 [Polyangia bacterium]|nr:hypothetical protein [Polyangia bacterium]